MDMKINILSIVVLAGLAVLIALVIALFNRKGRKFLAFFGIALLAMSIAIVVVGLFSFRVSHPVTQEAVVSRHDPGDHVHGPAGHDPAGDLGPIWSDGLEDEFQVDVYPSKRAAVLAAGRRAAETTIGRVLAGPQVSREIALLNNNNDRFLMAELAETIQEHVGREGVTCRVLQDLGAGDWSSKNGDMLTQLNIYAKLEFEGVTTGASSWDDGEETGSGTARLTVKGPGLVSAEDVHFVEKPWIENFAGFASRYPGREFYIARSRQSAVSSEQAGREAMDDATRIVADRLLNIQSQQEVWGSSSFILDQDDLTEFGFVVDKFFQCFNGSVSPIHRQAVLIEITPDRLRRLADCKLRIVRVRRRTWAGMVASLAGVMALICGVYFFLDFATRGYYTLALRILAIIIAVAGVVVMLFVA